MALAYTREFLIEAYTYRFAPLGEEAVAFLKDLAEKHYDKVGKDEFRKAASLDADAIKLFKAYKK